MHRFFSERIDENTACLPPEEAAHALRVLRMKEGDECQALLEGDIYAAHIRSIGSQVVLSLEKKLPSPEAKVRVTLYQGIPKGDKMDFIVQKCTEAGIDAIVPVAFSRCVTKWEGKDAEKKLLRYQRIAAEAAKQSGRSLTPRVLPPLSFEQMLAQIPSHALCLVPWEEERGHGIRANWQGQTDTGIVIGPEGGIDGLEIERLKENGAKPVTLGPRIFRTETAGLAALISLLTLSGDLE